MLHLLIDTSTWLDLAKRRDGQKWIVAVRVLVHHDQLELLVPPLVVEEFERNRPRIEASMTATVADRFRSLKLDLEAYGGENSEQALAVIGGLAHQVPLIGAMTTRNFDEIGELLAQGRRLDASDAERQRVVQRGLDGKAPFHRSENSVADALLVELYGTSIGTSDLAAEPHGFVSSNSADFSSAQGDKRQPHADLAEFFEPEGSSYHLGVQGLDVVLALHLADDFRELVEESDFQEEPRRLDEILSAEQEFFNRVSYQRSVNRAVRNAGASGLTEAEDAKLDEGMARLEDPYGDGGPYDDFEWGMINGKLSALRWVLGSEWDFLDT